MRLGFYTYSYLDKLQMPIEPCLERIARAGYSGIDVSGTFGNSDDPKSVDAPMRRALRAAAETSGLRIEGIITHAQLTDTLGTANRQPLDLQGTVDLAVDLGADVVTFHMGGVPAGADRNSFWKLTAETIRSAADYGAARHVALAVDGIWPTWLVDSPDALQKLFDEVDHQNFGVNFDPSYLTLMGVALPEFVERFHRMIVHVHLKDHTGKYPEWKHQIPGNGDMDYAAMLTALARHKFAGSLSIECFTDMPFEEACDRGYVALSKAAKTARVEWTR